MEIGRIFLFGVQKNMFCKVGLPALPMTLKVDV